MADLCCGDFITNVTWCQKVKGTERSNLLCKVDISLKSSQSWRILVKVQNQESEK